MKIINKKRFITFVAISILLLISIFNLCFAKSEVITEDYVVSKGESIWSIACENTSRNVRKYIHELRKINDLDDCMIYPGQVIKIIK